MAREQGGVARVDRPAPIDLSAARRSHGRHGQFGHSAKHMFDK